MRCSWARLVVVVSLAVALGGCRGQPYVDGERLDRGLVMVLSGIGGRFPSAVYIAEGLDEGGVDYAIEIYDWALPVGGIISLRSEEHNREQAAKAAERIVTYQDEYPGRPTFVIGHSGGGGVAVWVVENLPFGHEVNRVVLVAPAVSPDYDLAVALSRTQDGIVSFHSDRDWLILGWGTSTFGTIDGQWVDSAGLIGFSDAATANAPADAPRLLEVPWTPDMTEYGYRGGHVTSINTRFIANVVAPHVLGNGPKVVDRDGQE